MQTELGTEHGDHLAAWGSQGLAFRLELFKTEGRGWGVRTWDTIPQRRLHHDLLRPRHALRAD